MVAYIKMMKEDEMVQKYSDDESDDSKVSPADGGYFTKLINSPEGLLETDRTV